MKKNKSIVFILDSFELYSFKNNNFPKKTYCYSYLDTEEAIKNNIDNIITYDIGHLSFDLEDLGYTIFIGYNGHTKEFHSGMSTANGKELRKAHDLRKILIGGALNSDLNIPNKPYHISVDEILNRKTNKELDIELEKNEFMSDFINGKNNEVLFPLVVNFA